MALFLYPLRRCAQVYSFCVPNCPLLPDLVDYFDTTFNTASARRIQRPQTSAASVQDTAVAPVRLRRIPPSFPPDKWNVHDATLTHGDRTDNACESWNNGFRQLVGHSRPGD